MILAARLAMDPMTVTMDPCPRTLCQRTTRRNNRLRKTFSVQIRTSLHHSINIVYCTCSFYMALSSAMCLNMFKHSLILVMSNLSYGCFMPVLLGCPEICTAGSYRFTSISILHCFFVKVGRRFCQGHAFLSILPK